jgi:formylglycine-generating enzyme required for sulfatase activity
MSDLGQHGKAHDYAIASCCTLTAHHEAPAQPQNPLVLQGGRSRHRNSNRLAFPADGEGPIRPVTLSPFRIDTCPVTNRDFAAFTAVRTEQFRYAEFGPNAANGAMLFDVHADPMELTNLAEEPKHQQTRAALSKLIANYTTAT